MRQWGAHWDSIRHGDSRQRIFVSDCALIRYLAVVIKDVLINDKSVIWVLILPTAIFAPEVVAWDNKNSHIDY